MNKNFVIRDAVALDVSGVCVDLHNDFDLRDVSISLGDRRVLLRFERNAGARTVAGPKNVNLEVSGVAFLIVAAGAVGLTNRDVVEIGYKRPGDFDHDWLVPESKAEDEDHLFFRLVGDDFIRVHGEYASVSFVPNIMN